MDFIPIGFLTIPDSLDRLLRHRHGSDFGKTPLKLEDTTVEIPGTEDENGNPFKGQPLDRKAIASYRQAYRECQVELSTALQAGELSAEVDNGPAVPRMYWETDGAQITLKTGDLELGPAAKEEDLQYQHKRVLISTVFFEAWLASGSAAKQGPRRLGPEADALFRNKIGTVISRAKHLWPVTAKRPGRNEMARQLSEDATVKNATGYKPDTIKKILNGTYSVSKRLGILGLPGIDPRVS